jgi:hypothetical protein
MNSLGIDPRNVGDGGSQPHPVRAPKQGPRSRANGSNGRDQLPIAKANMEQGKRGQENQD